MEKDLNLTLIIVLLLRNDTTFVGYNFYYWIFQFFFNDITISSINIRTEINFKHLYYTVIPFT